MPKHQLVVIGAGPGGYVAAIKAAQLGLDVACVEKEPALGGTCLRVGCIPSKALLDSTEHIYRAKHGLIGAKIGQVLVDLPGLMLHKDKVVKANTDGIEFLFKKNKVTRYQGHARFVAPGKMVVEGAERVDLEADRIIVATGSKVSLLPGVELDYDRVGTSTEALSYQEVPETLVVIGAGIIGLELGSVWHRLGSKVIVLEYLPRVLPGMDQEVARSAEKIFKKQGLDIRTGVRVTKAYPKGRKAFVEYEGGEPLKADRVLVAVGRAPNTEGLGLEALGITLDERGRIPVDGHFQTSVPGVYAIGDVIRGAMLAHKAEEEAVAVVEQIVSGYGHVDYNSIPNVVYTHPEIASVGKSEEELKAEGVPYKKGSFPFQANGRARAMNDTEGFVKVLSHAQTDRVLGVHIIGPRAGDLIAEAATAMAFEASSEDIARASHAHPTLAEALKEAAMAASGKPIHI